MAKHPFSLLFLIRILLVLLVLCESDPASATAERLFVCTQTHFQISRPTGFMMPVLLCAFSQFPRVYNRVSSRRYIGRSIFAQQSDKQSRREPSGQRKIKNPPDYTTFFVCRYILFPIQKIVFSLNAYFNTRSGIKVLRSRCVQYFFQCEGNYFFVSHRCANLHCAGSALSP